MYCSTQMSYKNVVVSVVSRKIRSKERGCAKNVSFSISLRCSAQSTITNFCIHSLFVDGVQLRKVLWLLKNAFPIFS